MPAMSANHFITKGAANVMNAMSAKAESLFEDLTEAVRTDKLILPTLPDVALKIRDAVESERNVCLHT